LRSKILNVFCLLILIDILFISIFLAFSNAIPLNGSLGLMIDSFKFWFDINGEGNLISWYSSSKLLLSSILLAIIFLNKGYFSAMLGSLLLMLMSADEGGQIHERLGLFLSKLFLSSSNTVTGISTMHDWPYVVAPIGVFLVIVFIRTLIKEKSLGLVSVVNITLGLLILLVGSVGFEIVAHNVTSELLWGIHPNVIEEFLELVGSSIIMVGCIYGLTEKIQFRVSSRAVKVLNVAIIISVTSILSIGLVELKFLSKKPVSDSLDKVNSVTFKACMLPRLKGVLVDNCSVQHGANDESIMVFGPYQSLPTGTYILELVYSSSKDQNQLAGKWDIVHSGGLINISKGVINGSNNLVNRSKFIFHVESENVRDFEVRIYGLSLGSILLKEYSVIKSSSISNSNFL
jgi:cytochrome b